MRSFFSKILRQPSSTTSGTDESATARPPPAPSSEEASDSGNKSPKSPKSGGSFSRSFFRRQSSRDKQSSSKPPDSLARLKGHRKRRYNSQRRAPASLLAFSTNGDDVGKEELERCIVLAEDVLPGLLVDTLREKGDNLKSVVQILGGHVEIREGTSRTVHLLRASEPAVQGLSFQVLDLLEQIVCAIEDGPDACAAVGLPAQLLKCMALFHRVPVVGDLSAMLMRKGSLSSELSIDEEGFIDDQLTESEGEGEADTDSVHVNAKEAGEGEEEAGEGDGLPKQEGKTVRIKRSEAVFQRTTAALCHLVSHVAVSLSLLREPDCGLDVLFRLVQCTGGQQSCLDIFEAMGKGKPLPAVLEYIRDKGLLRRLVKDLSRIVLARTSDPTTFLPMVSSLVKLLLASSRASLVLLEEFRDSGGYVLLYNALALYPKSNEAIIAEIRQLVYIGDGYGAAEEEAERLGTVHSIFLARNDAAFAIFTALLTHLQLASCKSDEEVTAILMTRFAESWNALSPAGINHEKSISDVAVANTESLRLPLLHCILTIFSSNPVNFGILENKFRIMSTLLLSLGASLRVHDEFLFMVTKLLELISMGMDYRPKPLLDTICQQTLPMLVRNRRRSQGLETGRGVALSMDIAPTLDSVVQSLELDSNSRDSKVNTGNTFVLQVLCKTLVKMLHSDDDYKSMLQEAGIFGCAIVPFLEEAARLENPSSDPELFKLLPIWCMLLRDLLHNSASNELAFRDAAGHKALYKLIPIAPAPILGVLIELSKSDSPFLGQDLSALLELVQSLHSQRSLEVDILGAVLVMMQSNHRVKDLMRKCGGFESLLAVLLSLESSFKPDQSVEQQKLCVQVIEKVFQVFTVSMTGNHIANRNYLKEEIRYESISSTCQLIGIFGSENDHHLVDMVLDCITEAVVVSPGNPFSAAFDSSQTPSTSNTMGPPQDSFSGLRIRNVDPLQILTIRLSLLSDKGRSQLLHRLSEMVHGSHRDAPANCEILSETLIPRLLMEELFEKIVCDTSSELHETAISLFGALAKHHSTTRSVQQLFANTFKAFKSGEKESIGALLRLLQEASSPDKDDAFYCPYIQMAGPSDMFVLSGKETTESGSSTSSSNVARKLNNRPSQMSIVDSNAAGNVHIAGLGKRSWPPAAGYTLSMWVWLGEDVGKEILLASVRNTDGNQMLRITLDSSNSIRIATCAGSDSNSLPLATSISKGQQFFAKLDPRQSGRSGSVTSSSLSSSSSSSSSSSPNLQDLSDVSLAVMSAAVFAAQESASIADATKKTKLGADSVGETSDITDRIVRALAPASVGFPDLPLRVGRWHHLMFVHRSQTNIGILLDKSLGGKISLYLDGTEIGTQKLPYFPSSPLGGLKTSLFIGVDPIATAARRPKQPVRFWRLGPIQLLDVAKDAAMARTAFLLGVNYYGTLTRSSATLKDARAFTTMLLERLFSLEKNNAAEDQSAVVQHLERLNLPHESWKELLQVNSTFLHDRGPVDPESVVFFFFAGRRTTLEGFPSIDTKSLVLKNIKEIDVPRTVLINAAGQHQQAGQQPIMAVLGGGAFAVTPLPLCESIRSIGGVPVVLRFLELSREPGTILAVLRLLKNVLTGYEYNRFFFRHCNGHRILAWLLFGIARNSTEVFTPPVFESMLNLAVLGSGTMAMIVDPEMLHQLILNHQVWRGAEAASSERWNFVIIILQWLGNLVDEDNRNVLMNLDALHRLNIIDWVLEILLALAVDTPSDPSLVSDVFAAALQFLHNLNKLKLVRRSLFEMFKHILVSLPVQSAEDTESKSGETIPEGESDVEEEEQQEEDMDASERGLTEDQEPQSLDNMPPLSPVSNTRKDRRRSTARSARHQQRRRRTVTDMMIDQTGRWTEMRRVADQSDEATTGLGHNVSGQGASILSKIRCMLFELLIELPDCAPRWVDKARHRKMFYDEYSDILSVHWFTCLFNPALDSDTFLMSLRLLVDLLQESPEFARHFINAGGFGMVANAASLRPELPSVLFTMLFLFFGIPSSHVGAPVKFAMYEEDIGETIPARSFPNIPVRSGRATSLAAEENISAFVSPEVKKRLLHRKSTVESSSSVQVLETSLSAKLESVLEMAQGLTPPSWYLEVYGCIFALLKPLAAVCHSGNAESQNTWGSQRAKDLCIDMIRVFNDCIRSFPESQWMFSGSRALEISTELAFEEAAAADIDLIHSARGDPGVFTGPIAQRLLGFYVDLLCHAISEEEAKSVWSTSDSLVGAGLSSHGSSTSSLSSMGSSSPESPIARANRALRGTPRGHKDAKKLLEIMMTSFPVDTFPHHALWFQSSLVQALLPSLSLMLDDKTWAARESSGSKMRLPHNADPAKLMSVVAFLAHRASFGWIPSLEHTVLELTVQAYRCSSISHHKSMLGHAIRELVLWSLHTALENNIVDEEVQLCRAILRNFDILQVELFSSASSRSLSDAHGDPFIPAPMIPLPLRQKFNVFNEGSIFAVCAVFLTLEQLKIAGPDAFKALFDLLHALLNVKRDLFQFDPTLNGLLTLIESDSKVKNGGEDANKRLCLWLEENIYDHETEIWMSKIWARARLKEIFGGGHFATRRPSVVSKERRPTLLDPPEQDDVLKRKSILLEVEHMNAARRERLESFLSNQSSATNQLSSESVSLILSTQDDAVDRHKKWQRVGLEHLLRGKRLWKMEGDKFRVGINRDFFLDETQDNSAVVGTQAVYTRLDMSEGKDRMRRRIQNDLDFLDTYHFVTLESEEVQKVVETETPLERVESATDMEDEMNMVLRSIRAPSKGSRMRSLTEVDDVDSLDVDFEEDSELSSVRTSGGLTSAVPPSSPPRLSHQHRKVKSMQLPRSALVDVEEMDRQANTRKEEQLQCDDGDEKTADVGPVELGESKPSLEEEEGEDEDVDEEESDLQRGFGDEDALTGGRLESDSFDSFVVRKDSLQDVEGDSEVSDDLAVVSAESTERVERAPPSLPELRTVDEEDSDGIEIIRPGMAKPKVETPRASNGGRSISPAPRSPGGQVRQGMSLEDEMAALGWENVERILTELDYTDRKPEKIINCAEVNGMETTRGIFLVCTQAVYFATNYKITPEGSVEEVVEGSSGSRTCYDATVLDGYVHIIPQGSIEHGFGEEEDATGQGVVAVPHSIRKLRYDSLFEVYRRRYMFSEVGMELFSVDGINFLLVFDSPQDRDAVFASILSKELPSLVISKSDEMQGLARSSAMNPDGLSLGALMAPWKRFRASVTRKWRDGEISNFAYLVYLNTLAGRSHNDLTQYPVFPWILRQYSQETLDLEDPASFRDLSKPMGALNEERAKQFAERYASLASVAEETQIKPFHYGTHYSCSAYVLQFLIRLEPFTHMALELQGGQFDRPDRLFYSFAQSWRSVSGEDFNAQDVRELIPEFFYMPEFLENRNKFDFGITQRGKRVDNVELPAWSFGDPYRFIRLHRRALESRYVSEHLHEWIDLIFGYKQRGRAAIEAQNVFHPLTYEGEVNPDEIQDPLMRKATLAQIHNFGQTPRKLFSKPHPQRNVVALRQDESIFSADLNAVQWHTKMAAPLVVPGAYSRPIISHPGLMSTEAFPGHVALAKIENPSVRLVGQTGVFGVSELSFVGIDKIFGVTGQAAIVPPNQSYYISWGRENGSLLLHSVAVSALNYGGNSDKVVAVFEALHNGLITACSVTSDGKFIWTGGADALVGVWRLRKVKSKSSWTLDQVEYLASHRGKITSLATCNTQGIALSGSRDGSAVLWDLDKKCFLRELRRDAGPVNQVSINESNGNLLTFAGFELCLWHVNGNLIANVSLNPIMHDIRLDQPKCAVATNCEDYQDGIVAVTGHSNGVVAFWDLPEKPGQRSFELRAVVRTEVGAPVTALSLDTSQRRIVCGDVRGNVFAWASVESVLPLNKAADFFNRGRPV